MKAFAMCLVLLIESITSFMIKLHMTTYLYKNAVINASPYLQLISFELPTFELCIGTPVQCFEVAAANDFLYHYIPNVEVPLKTSRAFNKSQSSSVVDQMAIIYTSYQNTFLKGQFFKDVFHFPGGAPKVPMDFVLYEPYDDFMAEKFDGFFGFKQKDANDKSAGDTVWDTLEQMLNSHLVTSTVIAVNYNKRGGYLYIGEEVNQGNYTKCKSNEAWTCLMSSIQIVSHSYSFTFSVIFKSKNKVITGPKLQVMFVFENIMQLFPNKCFVHDNYSQSVLVCDSSLNVESIPEIRFYMVTGEYFAIKGRNIFERVIFENKERFVSTIICNNIGQVSWVVGIPGFMDNMLVFDNDHSIVGFFQVDPNPNDFFTKEEGFSPTHSPTLPRATLIAISLLSITGSLLLLFNKHYHALKPNLYFN